MNGQDLMLDLQDRLINLDKAINQLARNGQRLARAEHDYRVALAQRILIERTAGMPVTIIQDICRGDTAIAKLRMDRDVAQAVYEANQEAINAWKLQIRVIEGQIDREWGRSK